MEKYLGLTRQQLSDLFNYAYRLSMLVAPNKAEKYGLKNFDSSICLLFKDFSDLQDNKALDIENNYLYSTAYNKIVKDLNNNRYDCN